MKRSPRDAILDAAERLMADYGYHRVTMEEVAREAGLGRTTIYLHFKTKEEVSLAVLDRIHGRLLARLCEAAEVSGATPGERVRSMLRARLEVAHTEARNRPSRGFDEFYTANRPTYLERRRQYLENEANILAHVLDEGRQAGAFRFDVEAYEAALSLVIATNGLMPFSLGPGYADSLEQLLQRADFVIGLLVTGLERGA
ncbi:MAG: TetR/AcrR family transcriptional regulator [Armatimonadota bacterium]